MTGGNSMTIAKRLRFAALLAVLAINIASARAADEAKDPDTVWIVKRTGGTIQMLPVSQDALQPLLKKQAKAETANRADTAKSDHPLPLPEATSVSTGAAPKLFSQPAFARAVTVSKPSTSAQSPIPI